MKNNKARNDHASALLAFNSNAALMQCNDDSGEPASNTACAIFVHNVDRACLQESIESACWNPIIALKYALYRNI